MMMMMNKSLRTRKLKKMKNFWWAHSDDRNKVNGVRYHKQCADSVNVRKNDYIVHLTVEGSIHRNYKEMYIFSSHLSLSLAPVQNVLVLFVKSLTRPLPRFAASDWIHRRRKNCFSLAPSIGKWHLWRKNQLQPDILTWTIKSQSNCLAAQRMQDEFWLLLLFWWTNPLMEVLKFKSVPLGLWCWNFGLW